MRLDQKTVAVALGGEITGAQVLAPGPGHTPKDRSLSILIDDSAPDGFVVTSFSGDDPIACRDYVRDKLGMPKWEPKKKEEKRERKISSKTTYTYKTADELPYLQVRATRFDDGSKTFLQFHWGDLEWVKGKPDGPKIPYRLPELLAAQDDPVWLIEGEKAVDYARNKGLNATTFSEGAGKFTPEMAEWFKGRDVFIVADNDTPGRAYAAQILAQIPSAVIVPLPNQGPKHGLDDWLQLNGGTIDDLWRIALDPPAQMEDMAPEGDDAHTDAVGLFASSFQWRDPATLPKRQWLYGKHLIRRFVSVTIAPGGLGKSSLLMVEALCMASGKNLLGEYVAKPLNVGYWNGEDPESENRYRITAAAVHHKLAPEDFAPRLWLDTGREQKLVIATQGRDGVQPNFEHIAKLERTIIANQLDVVILDPFISTHAVSENDNGAIQIVVQALVDIAERCNCAIELVHHIRKPGAGTTTETTVDDARGASALLGKARSARVLNGMSQEEADRLEIPNRLAYFRVDNGKANLAPRSDKAVWRRIISHDLQNIDENGESDEIGVVERWELPEEASLIPFNGARIAQAVAVRAPCRAESQSSDWIGYPLAVEFGMNPTDKKHVTMLKKYVEQLVKNRVLVIEMKDDKHRNKRAFLNIGDPVND